MIGFMGSGKTTLGRLLAARLGVPFVDLDAEVEAARGQSVREILTKEGEATFRRLELEALRALVASRPRSGVVATGGGVVETPEARELLRALGTVVWLRAAPEICVERLGAARRTRPLLDAGRDWRRRYARREPLYRGTADHVVDTHPASAESSLGDLLRLLGTGGASGKGVEGRAEGERDAEREAG